MGDNTPVRKSGLSPFSEYLKKAVTLPPRVVIGRAGEIASRGTRRLWERNRDRVRPTYGARPKRGAELGRCFKPVPAEALAGRAAQLAATAEQAIHHRFDLLGSGWVKVAYGMEAIGLEGHRYPPGPAANPDPSGAWLEGRVNRANLGESRRVWSLVHGDYEPIDWHIDFKSGCRWPSAAWHRDIVFGRDPGADVKVPWELSRMQHLPLLALAYGQRGEAGFLPGDVYAWEFRNQVLDFIAANPPRFGVNWACPMDTAIRAANWLAAHDLFRAHGAVFDEPFEAELVRSVRGHARHVLDNLEWSVDLRGNHYLADVCGLLFAAAYLPRDRETDAWLAFAVRELIKEVGEQFHPDGSSFEGSTGYHRLSAEMAVWGAALVLGLDDGKHAALGEYDHRCQKRPPGLPPAPLPLYAPAGGGRPAPFPQWFWERLEKAAEFVLDAAGPDGLAVQIGDQDSGRFLKMLPAARLLTCAEARDRYANLDGWTFLPDGAPCWDEEQRDHAHLAAAAGALFSRPDFEAFAGRHWAEAALIRGLIGDGRPVSYLRPGEPHASFMVRVSEKITPPEITPGRGAGLVTDIEAPGGDLREGLALAAYPGFGLYLFRSRRLYLSVRCGAVGQKGRGGHDHNDQLSLALHVDGAAWISDPGSYLYTPLPGRRNEYRSVDAHFAPRPEGKGEPAGLDLGLFALGGGSGGECFLFGPGGFLGRHKGYGAGLWRKVEILADRVRVTDWFEGEGRIAVPAPVGPGRRSPRGPAVSPGYGRRLRA